MEARTARILSRAGAALVVVALAVLAVLARRNGVDAAVIQKELLGLGYLAIPAFLVAFAAGELLQLPGFLFVAVARVVFGPTVGLVLGYAGGVLAVTAAFLVAKQLVRAARASREPWRPRWRFLRTTFERLEAHPVRNVALLRLVLWFAPPLTYALATTGLRVRDHAMGSAIGLLVPVLAIHFVTGLV